MITETETTNPEILLVEDNFGDIRLVAEAFRLANLPYNLRVVENGEEALNYLHRNGEKYQNSPRPNLILLDLNMDVKDGRETLTEIKSDILFRDIPIVIFTTSGNEEDVVDAYRHSANAYVIKQENLDGFVNAIVSITDFWFNIAKHPRKS